MTGVAVEQMLELWCVELRQVKAHLKSLFAHPSVATSAAAFLDGLLAPSGARPAGYGRRPPATRVLGASRLCSGAATGTRRRCGTWYASMPWRRSPRLGQSW